jgi:hypothetical protein
MSASASSQVPIGQWSWASCSSGLYLQYFITLLPAGSLEVGGRAALCKCRLSGLLVTFISPISATRESPSVGRIRILAMSSNCAVRLRFAGVGCCRLGPECSMEGGQRRPHAGPDHWRTSRSDQQVWLFPPARLGKFLGASRPAGPSSRRPVCPIPNSSTTPTVTLTAISPRLVPIDQQNPWHTAC